MGTKKGDPKTSRKSSPKEVYKTQSSALKKIIKAFESAKSKRKTP